MARTRPICRLFAFAALLPAAAALLLRAEKARGDIFVLTSQGEVHGELVNKNETPRKTYVVKTTSGGTVSLAADQVSDVKTQTPAEVKYDRYKVDCPDTVDGHWKMAEWCNNNHLTKERAVHLERIIQLDPNHAAARHGLGYTKINGRWTTQEQVMVDSGYIRSKQAPGKWVTPQEEELLANRKKNNSAQLEWNTKLKRWATWLGTDKAGQAVAGIEAITDPFAIRGLTKHLAEDNRRDARMLYLKALGRINVPESLDVLVNLSLHDGDEEVRIAAMDEVVARQYAGGVPRYVQALKDKNNAIVNRAGAALGLLKDPAAIQPLIDALVTTHTFVVQKGQPGSTSATFGNVPGGGGGGFSFGGSGTETIKKTFENRDVLQALVDLSGGTSFNFDVKAWKYWYVGQKKPNTIDARRDAS
jgi:hypothetical protein